MQNGQLGRAVRALLPLKISRCSSTTEPVLIRVVGAMEQPVLLKFSALPGSSLSKPRKGAVSEYGIAVGPASDIKAAHAQVRAAFKVTAANQQLLVRANAFDHQLMDVLSSAEKFAKSPALSAPPPGWDPATRQAQLQLTLFKQPKESTPRAAASASEGNPPIASSAAAKPVWSTVKKLIRQEPCVLPANMCYAMLSVLDRCFVMIGTAMPHAAC